MLKNAKLLLAITTFGLATFSSGYPVDTEKATVSQPRTVKTKKKIAKNPNVSVEEHCNTINTMFPDKSVLPAALATKVNKVKDPSSFSEESIARLVTKILSSDAKLNQEQMDGLQNIQNELETKLRNYTISGFSWAVDPNLAFFLNHQNPSFSVTYKNKQGDIKVKNFDSVIKSIGLKLEASIRLDFILFVNTDLNFYDSNETIELGMGIEVGFGNSHYQVTKYLMAHPEDPNCKHFRISFLETQANLSITYAPFKNATGGLLIISIPLGWAPFFNLSLVTGGHLTPTN